jgi:homoserine kinase type II
MLQFSIRGEAGVSPVEWPDDLDPRRLRAFLDRLTCRRAASFDERRAGDDPWLMIEAMVAESAIPVANHGTFADLHGGAFMDLVLRKCNG